MPSLIGQHWYKSATLYHPLFLFSLWSRFIHLTGRVQWDDRVSFNVCQIRHTASNRESVFLHCVCFKELALSITYCELQPFYLLPPHKATGGFWIRIWKADDGTVFFFLQR